MQAKLQAIPTPPPCQHQHLHPRKPQPFLLFHVTLSILIHHPRLHRTAAACLLKIMIKFKIKFEIIFVKLKLKSFRIQENPSDAASSGYNAQADVPVPSGPEAPQDSSSPIACVYLVNENSTKTKLKRQRKRNDNSTKNENETQQKRTL